MDEINYIRFILAFVFVLGLIGLFAMALKKWGGRLSFGSAVPGGRLKVVEACHLGPRHRMVLVRRDNTEHLLLIGPESQLVIEQGIASHAHR